MLTGTVVNDNATVPAAITAGTLLNNTGGGAPGLGTATVADGDSFTVNGKTITFKAGAAPLAAAAPTGYGIDAGAASVATDGNGNSLIYIGASSTTSTATVGDVLRAIDLASGVRSSVVASGVATTRDQRRPDRLLDHGGRGQPADFDRWRFGCQRQGRLPQCARPDHRRSAPASPRSVRPAPPAR